MIISVDEYYVAASRDALILKFKLIVHFASEIWWQEKPAPRGKPAPAPTQTPRSAFLQNFPVGLQIGLQKVLSHRDMLGVT